MKNKNIKIIVCEPGKVAEAREIPNTLETFQSIVEGYIEAYYPFKDEVCVVCNEEGKMNGSLPNRAFYEDNGEISDVVFGTFIICGLGEDNFKSLTDEQTKKYLKMLRYPHNITLENGRIVVTEARDLE